LQNNPTINGISAGTYYVLVETSVQNCFFPHFEQVIIPPGPRTPVSAAVSVTSNYNGAQLSCTGVSDGQLTVTASGGNGSYKYYLDGVLKPANIISSVGSGTHTIRIEDTCPVANSFTTNIALSDPDPVVIPSVNPTFCNGANNAAVTITASGGTGTLLYSINNGAYQTSNVFSGLAAPETYTVRVKDANECSAPSSVVVPGPLVSGAIVVTHPTCTGLSSGQLLMSSASGGTPPYTYSIPGHSAIPVGTPITGVAPGTYVPAVIDAQGCMASGSAIIVNQPVVASHTTIPVSCAGKDDGVITVSSASGGTGSSYSYALNYAPYSTFSTMNVFTGLPAASYTIKVRGVNNC
jgi:hypothetical protein